LRALSEERVSLEANKPDAGEFEFEATRRRSRRFASFRENQHVNGSTRRALGGPDMLIFYEKFAYRRDRRRIKAAQHFP
jgi:hypothetical protein